MATQINIPDNLVSYAEWAADIAAVLIVMIFVNNILGAGVLQALGFGWLNVLLGWPAVIVAGFVTYKAVRRMQIFT